MGYLKKDEYIARYGETTWEVEHERRKAKQREAQKRHRINHPEKDKEYYLEHREERLKYSAEHFQKNKAKKTEQKRRNRQENRDKFNEYNREYAQKWRENNKEHFMEYRENYEKTPSGRASKLCSNYKSDDRIKGRIGNNLTTQWILENIFASSCVYCGETDYLKLGCDRIDNSLPHTQENCVCACWDCNNDRQKKGMSVEEYIKYKKVG